MFFTETSRRKGAERNGPMKVIRMRLQGRVPTARSSLSALGAVGEHLETTSLASYTFITPQTETPKQSSPGVQGKIRFQSLAPEHLSLLKFSAKLLLNMGESYRLVPSTKKP